MSRALIIAAMLALSTQAEAAPKTKDALWHKTFEECRRGVSSTPSHRGCYVGLNRQIKRR